MYLGDNARAPYGNRSTETLIEFAEQAVEYLFDQGCSLIIIACNTASSNVLRHLQEKYLRKPGVTDRKILGVIKPQVEAAVKLSKSGRIGVVGTRGTIESKSFDIELQHLRPDVQIAKQACPLLVPLIEEHWHNKPETTMILKKYLRNLKTHNVDTLMLACTHYPFLYGQFKRIMGKNVRILNPGPIVAASLKDYLHRHPEIEKKLTKKGKRVYCTTGDPRKFSSLRADAILSKNGKKMGSEFLEHQLQDVRHVDLAAPKVK